MTPEQQHYIQKRLRHIRWWNWLGWLFLPALAAFYGWLWHNKRVYIDPMLLLDKLRLGQISDIEIAKLAALGNLAFLGCGLLLASIVLLTYAALWTEKQTIQILLKQPPVEPVVTVDPPTLEETPSDESKQP
jgi:hypothetical protein